MIWPWDHHPRSCLAAAHRESLDVEDTSDWLEGHQTGGSPSEMGVRETANADHLESEGTHWVGTRWMAVRDNWGPDSTGEIP